MRKLQAPNSRVHGARHVSQAEPQVRLRRALRYVLDLRPHGLRRVLGVRRWDRPGAAHATRDRATRGRTAYSIVLFSCFSHMKLAYIQHMRVLVVEDDPKMARLLRRGLTEDGQAADVASQATEALVMAGSTDYDAIILDVMLPDMDRFEVCRRLRAQAVWVPVLMLTARHAVEDRVTGLDAGADDYLTKPFSFAELLAR